MKRMITVLTVAALMAMMLVAGAGSVFAKAYTEESGGPSQGNITEEADRTCDANLRKQNEAEVAAGGGPKQDFGSGAPTNCDHFYQREGRIGQPE